MSTRFDPDELRDLEHRLTERLEDIAPRPRAAAADRLRAEISVTQQRRGPVAWLRTRSPRVAWSRVAAVTAVAVAALAVGIGIGSSGILPVGKSPQPSPSGVVASPAPFGEAWQQVTIEPADTPGDYVVEGGYAGETRTVLVGMIAGPAAQAAGHTTPAAWYSDDGVTWHRSEVVVADESAPLVRLDVFDLNTVFPGPDRLYGFGTAVQTGGPVSGSENLSVLFESTDGGATWVQVTDASPPTGGFVRDVAAGGPGYVAVGDRGLPAEQGQGERIWTSVDGLDWHGLGDPADGQPRGLVLASGGLSAVAEHDGTLMAVGTTLGDFPDTGAVLVSHDGTVWSPLDIPSGMVPRDVAWSASGWTIVGEIGRQTQSGDVVTSVTAAAAWRSMDDGLTWRQVIDGGGGTPILSVNAGKEGLVAAGDGTRSAYAYTSVDGEHWEEHRLAAGPLANESARLALVTGQGLLVAGNGRSPSAARLPLAWISEVQPLRTPPPEPAVESPTPAPTVGPTPGVSTVPLAEPPVFADWTRIDLPDPAPNVFGGSNPVGVVRFGGRWIAMGSVNGGCCDGHYSEDTRGVIWTSLDGRTWELVPSQASLAAAEIGSIATNGKVIVAVGSVVSDDGSGITRHDPAAWISANGTTWERVPGVPGLQLVTPRGTGFVAVSGDRQHIGFYTSPDGRTWDVALTVDYPDPASAVVLGLTVGPGGTITAVGEATTVESGQSVTRATVWTTPDPELGLSILNPLDNASMRAVAVVDGMHVALGTDLDGEQLLSWSSTDGLDWSRPALVERVVGGSLAPSVALVAGSELIVAGHVTAAGSVSNGAVWVRANDEWYRVDGTTAFSGFGNEIFGMAWDGEGQRVIAGGFYWDETHARPAIWVAPR